MDNEERESARNKWYICLKLQAAAGLGSNEFVDGNSWSDLFLVVYFD